MLQREHKGKNVIIYPAYLDSSLTRKEGRRISIEHSVKDPKPDEIAKAARNLGLDAYIEEGRYPRIWWKYKYRVVVSKNNYSKRELLRMIAEEINKSKRK